MHISCFLVLHAVFLVVSITAVSSRIQQHETSCVQEILTDYRKKKLKRKNERKRVKQRMQERERK
jgi:hypothetical protein